MHQTKGETDLAGSKLPEPETPSKTQKRLQIPFHKPAPRHIRLPAQHRQQSASQRKATAAAVLKGDQKPSVLGKVPIRFIEGKSWYDFISALDVNKYMNSQGQTHPAE